MIPGLSFLSLPDNVIASAVNRVGISLGASVKAIEKNKLKSAPCQHGIPCGNCTCGRVYVWL